MDVTLGRKITPPKLIRETVESVMLFATLLVQALDPVCPQCATYLRNGSQSGRFVP